MTNFSTLNSEVVRRTEGKHKGTRFGEAKRSQQLVASHSVPSSVKCSTQVCHQAVIALLTGELLVPRGLKTSTMVDSDRNSSDC